jgi:hypothetical protein
LGLSLYLSFASRFRSRTSGSAFALRKLWTQRFRTAGSAQARRIASLINLPFLVVVFLISTFSVFSWFGELERP